MTAISDENKGGSAKRWLGYTCPECFAIFRIPVEGQGKVAECPHCDLPVILGHRESVADAADAAAVAAAEAAGAAGNAAEAVWAVEAAWAALYIKILENGLLIIKESK